MIEVRERTIEMDFHGMKRKELQALCKQHSIPANLTNCDMADRLVSLFKEKETPVSPLEDMLVTTMTVVVENDSKIVVKKVKKVTFSPDNETFIFQKSDKESDSDEEFTLVKRSKSKRKAKKADLVQDCTGPTIFTRNSRRKKSVSEDNKLTRSSSAILSSVMVSSEKLGTGQIRGSAEHTTEVCVRVGSSDAAKPVRRSKRVASGQNAIESLDESNKISVASENKMLPRSSPLTGSSVVASIEELGTDQIRGRAEQSAEVCLWVGSSDAVGLVRQSKRVASGQNETESLDESNKISVATEKGRNMKRKPESEPLSTEFVPVTENPTRRSTRAASKSILIATTEQSGKGFGKKQRIISQLQPTIEQTQLRKSSMAPEETLSTESEPVTQSLTRKSTRLSTCIASKSDLVETKEQTGKGCGKKRGISKLEPTTEQTQLFESTVALEKALNTVYEPVIIRPTRRSTRQSTCVASKSDLVVTKGQTGKGFGKKQQSVSKLQPAIEQTHLLESTLATERTFSAESVPVVNKLTKRSTRQSTCIASKSDFVVIKEQTDKGFGKKQKRISKLPATIEQTQLSESILAPDENSSIEFEPVAKKTTRQSTRTASKSDLVVTKGKTDKGLGKKQSKGSKLPPTTEQPQLLKSTLAPEDPQSFNEETSFAKLESLVEKPIRRSRRITVKKKHCSRPSMTVNTEESQFTKRMVDPEDQLVGSQDGVADVVLPKVISPINDFLSTRQLNQGSEDSNLLGLEKELETENPSISNVQNLEIHNLDSFVDNETAPTQNLVKKTDTAIASSEPHLVTVETISELQLSLSGHDALTENSYTPLPESQDNNQPETHDIAQSMQMGESCTDYFETESPEETTKASESFIGNESKQKSNMENMGDEKTEDYKSEETLYTKPAYSAADNKENFATGEIFEDNSKANREEYNHDPSAEGSLHTALQEKKDIDSDIVVLHSSSDVDGVMSSSDHSVPKHDKYEEEHHISAIGNDKEVLKESDVSLNKSTLLIANNIADVSELARQLDISPPIRSKMLQDRAEGETVLVTSGIALKNLYQQVPSPSKYAPGGGCEIIESDVEHCTNEFGEVNHGSCKVIPVQVTGDVDRSFTPICKSSGSYEDSAEKAVNATKSTERGNKLKVEKCINISECSERRSALKMEEHMTENVDFDGNESKGKDSELEYNYLEDMMERANETSGKGQDSYLNSIFQEEAGPCHVSLNGSNADITAVYSQECLEEKLNECEDAENEASDICGTHLLPLNQQICSNESKSHVPVDGKAMDSGGAAEVGNNVSGIEGADKEQVDGQRDSLCYLDSALKKLYEEEEASLSKDVIGERSIQGYTEERDNDNGAYQCPVESNGNYEGSIEMAVNASACAEKSNILKVEERITENEDLDESQRLDTSMGQDTNKEVTMRKNVSLDDFSVENILDFQGVAMKQVDDHRDSLCCLDSALKKLYEEEASPSKDVSSDRSISGDLYVDQHDNVNGVYQCPVESLTSSICKSSGNYERSNETAVNVSEHAERSNILKVEEMITEYEDHDDSQRHDISVGQDTNKEVSMRKNVARDDFSIENILDFQVVAKKQVDDHRDSLCCLDSALKKLYEEEASPNKDVISDRSMQGDLYIDQHDNVNGVYQSADESLIPSICESNGNYEGSNEMTVTASECAERSNILMVEEMITENEDHDESQGCGAGNDPMDLTSLFQEVLCDGLNCSSAKSTVLYHQEFSGKKVSGRKDVDETSVLYDSDFLSSNRQVCGGENKSYALEDGKAVNFGGAVDLGNTDAFSPLKTEMAVCKDETEVTIRENVGLCNDLRCLVDFEHPESSKEKVDECIDANNEADVMPGSDFFALNWQVSGSESKCHALRGGEVVNNSAALEVGDTYVLSPLKPEMVADCSVDNDPIESNVIDFLEAAKEQADDQKDSPCLDSSSKKLHEQDCFSTKDVAGGSSMPGDSSVEQSANVIMEIHHGSTNTTIQHVISEDNRSLVQSLNVSDGTHEESVEKAVNAAECIERRNIPKPVDSKTESEDFGATELEGKDKEAYKLSSWVEVSNDKRRTETIAEDAGVCHIVNNGVSVTQWSSESKSYAMDNITLHKLDEKSLNLDGNVEIGKIDADTALEHEVVMYDDSTVHNDLTYEDSLVHAEEDTIGKTEGALSEIDSLDDARCTTMNNVIDLQKAVKVQPNNIENVARENSGKDGSESKSSALGTQEALGIDKLDENVFAAGTSNTQEVACFEKLNPVFSTKLNIVADSEAISPFLSSEKKMLDYLVESHLFTTLEASLFAGDSEQHEALNTNAGPQESNTKNKHAEERIQSTIFNEQGIEKSFCGPYQQMEVDFAELECSHLSAQDKVNRETDDVLKEQDGMPAAFLRSMTFENKLDVPVLVNRLRDSIGDIILTEDSECNGNDQYKPTQSCEYNGLEGDNIACATIDDSKFLVKKKNVEDDSEAMKSSNDQTAPEGIVSANIDELESTVDKTKNEAPEKTTESSHDQVEPAIPIVNSAVQREVADKEPPRPLFQSKTPEAKKSSSIMFAKQFSTSTLKLETNKTSLLQGTDMKENVPISKTEKLGYVTTPRPLSKRRPLEELRNS